MTWNEEVDRAFARRREELLRELQSDGARVIDEMGAVVDAIATNHPLAYVGAGVAAGAGMTMAPGVVPSPRRVGQWWRAWRFGARLLG